MSNNNSEQQTQWQVLESADQVAEVACKLILEAAASSIAERGVFKIVLAGGTTPEKVYRLLAQSNAEWPHWFVFHGDERCLPSSHQDRNSVMAAHAWLDHVAIPKGQIHDIPAELGPEQGAASYANTVANALPFNLVLLGMGEDGHTASLFPGHIHDLEALTLPVFNSPKPPPERVSLSAKALGSTKAVLFLVTGKNKQEAVKRWRSGELLPVATIKADSVLVLCDREAYGAEKAPMWV